MTSPQHQFVRKGTRRFSYSPSVRKRRAEIGTVAEKWGVVTPFANIVAEGKSSNTIRNSSVMHFVNHLKDFNKNHTFKIYLVGEGRRLWQLISSTNHVQKRSSLSSKQKKLTWGKCTLLAILSSGISLIIALVNFRNIISLTIVLVFTIVHFAFSVNGLYLFFKVLKTTVSKRIMKGARAITAHSSILFGATPMLLLYQFLYKYAQPPNSCSHIYFVAVGFCLLALSVVILCSSWPVLPVACVSIVLTMAYLICLFEARASECLQHSFNYSRNATTKVLATSHPAASWPSILLLLAILLVSYILRSHTLESDQRCLDLYKEEQEDIKTMQDLNIILLRNILPAHVATYFLDFGNDPSVLYHENHDFVTVMFASIPNFAEFWKDKDKLECLRLLNEIIGDFDKVFIDC